jgi:site-specific DNA recombinase
MRCVIYLRVSTKEQAERDLAEGFSIPAQREACARHVADAGWTLVDEYVDRGESARTADRPQLQALMRRIAGAGDVDAVVVHKVDRLARNLEDHVAIRALLRRKGVSLVSVSENLEESASGKLVEGIHALMAEFYSSNLSSEIRKGMSQKAKLGGWPHQAPLGYLNVRRTTGGRHVATIEPDPDRAHLIRTLFDLYASGEWTIERLAVEMDHRGLRTRGRRDHPGGPVGVSGIARLLSNKAYAGIVEWNGVEYPGLHEPIVDCETFARVQDLLASRAVNGVRERRHNHHLKGLLFCGVCGRRLSCQWSKGRYLYFYCLGQKGDPRQRTGCRERYVSADALEAQVEALYERVQLPAKWTEPLSEAITAELAARSASTTAERQSLQRQRDQLEAERRKLLEAYYANAIDIRLLKEEQDRLGGELRRVDDRLAAVDGHLAEWQEVLHTAVRLASDCARSYRGASDTGRRRLNQALLAKLEVREGRIALPHFQAPFDSLLSGPKFEYELLVELRGIEPLTSSMPWKRSTN